MNKTGNYFKLFACCIPVDGTSRSLICDVQRSYFFYIPNILFEILNEHGNKAIADIKAHYNHEADDVIDEYFDFLISNELGFFTDEPELFPKMDMSWKAPSLITNAIIEVKKDTKIPFKKVLEELDHFNCKALEIRCYDAVSLSEIKALLNETLGGKLHHIELILKFSKKTNRKNLESLAKMHSRLNSILIHSADFEDSFLLEVNDNYTELVFTEQIIDSSKHCGFIHTNYFSINENSFFESNHFNSCLNRKIAIDLEGEIKNCPAMVKTYGNVKNTPLSEAIEQDEFKTLWHITKNQIDKCKGCEFRYVCTDCRAFLANPDDVLSAPLKCGYNPETNVWSAWSNNPLKEKAIKHYGLQSNLVKA